MSTSTSTSAALPGFARLGRGVWLSTPSSAQPQASNPDTVQFIVICAWMGASPRHVAKYTTECQRLHPRAQLAVIQSEPADLLWHTDAHEAARMAGVCDAVCATLESGGPRSVAMHVFSNGGALSACQLAMQIRRARGHTLTLRALVCDSCPGKPTMQGGFNALAVGLPKGRVSRWIGVFVIWLVLALFWVSRAVLRHEDVVSRSRRMLNDAQLFDRETRKVYLFSEADRMVQPSEVEEHVAAAKAGRYQVSSKRFEASGHCAHAMMYKGAYWSVVQEALK